jgi:MoaA/NifB/PqqE/SkfB family radical SAM enzyme
MWRCHMRLARAVVKNALAQWFVPSRAFPYRLGLSVTNRCNHRCLTCGIWHTARDNPGVIHRELTLEEYDALFRSFGAALRWVGITGGEPTLRRDLADIARTAARNCPSLGFVSINSNGFLTDRLVRTAEDLLGELRHQQLLVVVSLDGPRELHDRARGVDGAFDRAVASITALQDLSERHPQLSVRTETVISEFNLAELETFSQSTPVAGVPHVYTFAMEGSRYSNTGSGVHVSADDFRKIQALMPEFGRRGRLKGIERLIMEEYYRLTERFFADPTRQVLPCASSSASIYIGAEGELRPCSMMDPVGYLRDYGCDVRKIIASEAFQAVRGRIRRGQCPNCWTPCEAVTTLIHHQGRALPALLTTRRCKR